MKSETKNSMRHLFVTGDACPQLPLRILGIFARASAIPATFECHLQGDSLEIFIEICGDNELPFARLDHQIEKLIGVREVRLDSET